MWIGSLEVGVGQPCALVAEISNNHNGSLGRALRLIDAAAAAGASAVKFQCYTPDELVELRGDGPAPEPWGSEGWTMRRLYEKAQTPHTWFSELVARCEWQSVPWFSSVFGKEGLALLESLDCPAYKIAALDREQNWLVEAALDTGKPMFLSSPGDVPPVHADRYILYCPPGYPAIVTQLPQFRPSKYIGLSSHCLDPLLPVAAVARGAKLIEMHFQLDDEPSELEANISLTASQFAEMAQSVRKTEALLG